MAINTNERTFEQEIEWWLTEGAVSADRYKKGDPADFDRTLATVSYTHLTLPTNSRV